MSSLHSDIIKDGIEKIYQTDMESQSHYINIIAEKVRGMNPEPIYNMKGIFIPNNEYMIEMFGASVLDVEFNVYDYNGNCKYLHYLIFPIYNAIGEICGLTGFNPFNKLTKLEGAKNEDADSDYKMLTVYYDVMLNSYDKSKFIFGPKDIYERALTDGYIVIVDGFFDAISLQGAGINAGAFLGSMFSSDLAAILNLVDTVYIVADNDEAGLSLTNKIKSKIKTAVVISQDGFKDVDEVLKSKFREKFINDFNKIILSKSRLHYTFSTKCYTG